MISGSVFVCADSSRSLSFAFQKLGRDPSDEDCFFDLLSKFQSSRMDDQRCHLDEPQNGDNGEGAHHPTEIKATLETAKKYPHNKLYVVFQPHTYTRTKAFLSEFADALATAGHIIITDIYAAREKNPGDIHSKDIVALLEEKGVDVTYIDDFGEIADHLLLTCQPNDLVITMGAGNIHQVADILLGL